jgi:hypothetical protein
MDSIPYDFDDFRYFFTFPLLDSKSSGFCGCYSTYRGSGTFYFTVLSPIYEPFSPSILLYTFDFQFLSQFRTISTVSDTPLPPPYSIPNPVISVVAIAVIEVLVYTSIYGSLFRFPTFEPPPLLSSRPVMPVLRR